MIRETCCSLQMFELVLSELAPFCLAEQDFCVRFFHLTSSDAPDAASKQVLNGVRMTTSVPKQLLYGDGLFSVGGGLSDTLLPWGFCCVAGRRRCRWRGGGTMGTAQTNHLQGVSAHFLQSFALARARLVSTSSSKTCLPNFRMVMNPQVLHVKSVRFLWHIFANFNNYWTLVNTFSFPQPK